MTGSASGAAQRAVVPPEPDAESQGVQARARESVPAALPLTPALPPVQPSDADAESQIREAVARFLGAFAIPSGTDVLHASGLHAAHLRHKEAAAHWEAAIIRAPRRAWGWMHLLLKGCLGIADWVTESPARTFVAAMFLAACVIWL